jgi:hypothetical protein
MAIIHNLIAKFRADTGAFDRNIKKSRTHMTRFGRDVQRMGKQLLAVAGIGGGLYTLKRSLEYIVKASLEQEKAEKALSAAVQGSIRQYKFYAAQLQKVTIYGDEQILSQMAYAKNLGVTNEQLNAATKAAIGLAAKFRLDLASAMMLVGRASQGQTQMLTRYGIVIDQTLSDQEKFNELLRIGNNSFRLAEEQARENASAFSRLGNEVSDYAEIIGGPLAEAMAKHARLTTAWMIGNKADFARWISDIEEGIGMVEQFDKAVVNFYRNVLRWTPWGLLYRGMKAYTKPEPIARPKTVEDIHRITRQEMINKGLEDAMKIEQAWANFREMNRKNLIARLVEEGKKLREHGSEQKRIYADIARGMAREWSNAFDEMLFEGKKFGDAMKDMFRSILRMITQIITYETIAKPIAAGIMGVPAEELHAGGVVGSGGKKRHVPALAFAGAPRLHSGFSPDEFPAILQRGERVVPRGGGSVATAPTIIINNQTGQRMKLEREPMYDGKQWVIKVVAENIQRGGTLRKMMQTIK